MLSRMNVVSVAKAVTPVANVAATVVLSTANVVKAHRVVLSASVVKAEMQPVANVVAVVTSTVTAHRVVTMQRQPLHVVVSVTHKH